MLGPALLDDDRGDAFGAGASGYGVRLLVEVASRVAAALRAARAARDPEHAVVQEPAGGRRRLERRLRRNATSTRVVRTDVDCSAA